MKGILFLFWFLVLLLTVVLGLENPTPTTDWHNSSPNDSHQKESLANRWFKYLSSHWGRKFHYGCNTTPPPPVEPSLVKPNTSFYLLTYLVGYYLLGKFSLMMGRFAYLGHLGHLAMIMVPIGSVIAGLKLGALVHQVGNLFPVKWVPDAQVGKLSLEEARRAIPVLKINFLANAAAYPYDTVKVLGVASMLAGDALDWFGKATC
ncbi:hypothetical protein DSO57_1033750 [Entomophthora muscae]|uniref:Uncharacterized protein n=1 Tax=Entomophthora muscae TaxID=34485 RepID=A0ACC2RQW2_9FUNG|nr:hypothetical protein DSO57_1033750 [Entomophthora muscae]